MKMFSSLLGCLAALMVQVLAADAKELSITSIQEEPYVMTRGSGYEGYCVDLISELSKRLSFSYKLHVVKDGRYGAVDSSGNWNGMIGEVIRGEADLAVAPLTMTAAREQVVDMTTPFIQTGISFILRKNADSEESTFSVLAPLSMDLWVGVFLAFLLTGFCMFLVGRISPAEWAEPERDEHSFTLLHSFWYITGALTLQGAGPQPKAVSGRIIAAIWWMFSLVLLVCYFSSFSLMLRSDHRHMSISSFEDLANQNLIDYGTVQSGSTMLFFKNSNNPVFRRIYQHMERKKSFVSSMSEGVRRAKEGNFAFIGEAVSLDLAVARFCNLTRSPEVVSMRAYSVAAPLGYPLVKNLTIAILQLSETGELSHLRDKWWSSSCVGADEARSSNALKPDDLRVLFLLLGLGLGVGLLLALLELLTRARSRAKAGKKSCCVVLRSELTRRFGRGAEDPEPENLDKNKA
ncbi:probable glutamate receptor [Kryptolebias marmoratus]|uniref:probable glutamate receptor n=1 Tax=Kryptolebias marmoratus TaxID=37003 RepID=UPI0018ACBCA0|nr:probable glutamate receptor [Kryptolebias marmoratus]